ncbi:MAG TPA: hydrogenase maturation nickel metallochaperone HypA [Terriglobales bacterium]|nr:hydrogenase maturation nickel metallochaperone HypA [Terriglobales bacterium]
MHELGIATSILETVEKVAATHPGTRFQKVGLRIGEVAGLDVDSLTFGWECITKDTKWEGLQLEIERVPRKNRCEKCNWVFEVHDFTELECPRCDAFPTYNIGGDELEIAYIEAEDLEEAKL